MLKLLSVILCFGIVICSGISIRNEKGTPLPEENMDAIQLIVYNGYPAEEYTATTADGYVLTIHRIPYGKNGKGPDGKTRPVVFLMHGLEASSTCYLTNPANESLAYIMADAGMDVFLGNFRGNLYSMKHTSLDPKKHAFWEFSYDEMAAFDLPAMIDKALSVSGAEKLYYVGHSEGTITAFAGFSENLPLGAKIKHYFALAPVAKLEHIQGALHLLGEDYILYEWLIKLIDNNDFTVPQPIMDILAKYVCGSKPGNPLCDNIFFLIGGPNSNQLNETRVPVYAAHNPAGTSTQNMIHFAQGVRDKTFRKYDYKNADMNKMKYNQTTPPDYHPENMQVPVTLFCGALDYLADPQDVEWLVSQLKTISNQYNYEDFNHLDFIWGLRAPVQIYKLILNEIASIEKMNSS